jgi:hypothetical protein
MPFSPFFTRRPSWAVGASSILQTRPFGQKGPRNLVTYFAYCEYFEYVVAS